MVNFSFLHDTCIKVFEEISKTTNLFVLPLFLARVVFTNIMGDGAETLKAVRGAALYFILVAGFPYILELLFSIPESFLPQFVSVSEIKEGVSATSGISLIPFAVDKGIEVVLAALYWIAYYMHVFFMIIMVSMAPIIFVTSTVLGLGLGIEIFFALLIVGSSWPIIWHGFDQVHALLVSTDGDAFGMKSLEVLVTLLKGVCPSVFSGIAVKSPAGQAVLKGANMAFAGGSMISQKVFSSASSAQESSGGNGPQASSASSEERTRSKRSSGLSKVTPEELERIMSQNLKRGSKTESEKES